MILAYIQKFQKRIAFFLFSVFSMQLILPCITFGRSNSYFPFEKSRWHNSSYWHLNNLEKKSERGFIAERNFVKSFSQQNINSLNQLKFFQSGPGQPEQQSFQSVNAQNMVDLFSGDFSYNIPLLDVGGYPVNIHYRSGITMDQEASWVGLGWNINPGAINRNMRGLPDDFRGDQDSITKTQSIRSQWTAGINAGANPEIFGKEIPISANAGIFYNNYRGVGFEIGGGIDISLTAAKGAQSRLTAGLGINLNNNSQNGFSIEPSFSLRRQKLETELEGYSNGFNIGASFSTRAGLKDLSLSASGTRQSFNLEGDQRWSSAASTLGGGISFAHHSYIPTIHVPYTSYQFNFSLKNGGEVFGFHPLGSLSGYYSKQYIAPEDLTVVSPANGYLYLQNGLKSPASILDFNREKELAYSANPPTPHLAIPNYTYDIYSISGEGTGGMFRPFRGDIGYVRDAVMQSKSSSGGASLDLGVGEAWHGGVDVRVSNTVSKTGAWLDNNMLNTQVTFRDADSSFENVYFRNPSEKTSNTQNFYDAIGDTKPLLPVMTKSDDPALTQSMQPYSNYSVSGNKLIFDKSVLKTSRDKRSQVIRFLTAGDAAHFALDTNITSYPLNTFVQNTCNLDSGVVVDKRVNSFRKPNHISEITVLNEDGKRYIYGLPVYNLSQEEVSFSVNHNISNGGVTNNLVAYDAGENSTGNNSAKDHYYSKERIPAYASAFLITGLVSADYVDRTGNGISDDDQGDAVKFNYTQIYDKNNSYKWRTPFAKNKASYQEGLKTDVSDDKASYIYGTKEVWYLNSIVTKTMVAVFKLNDINQGEVRQDGYGVVDENGDIDLTKGLRYLKQIDLYSKADYAKNGVSAKPVKTVHFEYDYSLCQGTPDARNGQGKLTLKSIWFSYNGNNKGLQNPYLFHYSSNNPSYSVGSFDRWGNYKNQTTNPSGLSNSDFPYSLQDKVNNWDSTQAAIAASAWNLDSVLLPSSGGIKVDYESDDYAFIQNKRAAQMMQIVGLGNSSTQMDYYLYNNSDVLNLYDNNYVFIRVPETANSKSDVYKKYLDGIEKIYFTYRVKMPHDLYSGAEDYEHVSVYAQYDDYGISQSDSHIIWVHLKNTEDVKSPLAKAAIQALRLNLPSKAYPGSDLNGEYDPLAIGKAMIGFVANYSELITSFPKRSRILGIANDIDVARSFVRLNNPTLKKLGGGHRVKRITISDNFNKMTGLQGAVYGQEYDYTTTKSVNGIVMKISSGVAAWEPFVGNDENPFRTPIEYNQQVAPLAPTANMYSENPLGEGYFPAAQVGYSKVRVHTINNKVSSANGYEETEYYTAYDFPTITEQTPFDERRFKPSFLANLFKINAKSYLSQTQGFKVEINDMNGRIKGNASYSQADANNPIAYTKYYYKVDNDSAEFKHLANTIAVVDSSNGHINPSAQVGKDIELMIDSREELTETKGADLEFNMDGFIIGIIPVNIPTLWPFPQSETDRYRSVATMKLVQRYGILNKVMHYEKGSLVTTENLLFDAETGDVVLSKRQNEFNDPMYQFNYPAHWAYSGMEPAYKNIGDKFTGLEFTNGKITNAGRYSNIEHFFESGDELMLRNVTCKTGSSSNISCNGEGSCASPQYSWKPFIKVWAIDAAKIQNNKGLSGIYFVDNFGNFFTSQIGSGQNTTVEIVRSGKRNTASASLGTVQSLSSPLRSINNQWKIVFDDQTKVINTSAATYKDLWKVEDAKFVLDTVIINKTPALQTAYIFPTTDIPSFSIGASSGNWFALTNKDYYEAGRSDGGRNQGDHWINSWLRLNMLQSDLSTPIIPSGSQIKAAWLSLEPHLVSHQESGSGIPSEVNHTNTNPHIAGSNTSYKFARVTDVGFNNINYSALGSLGASVWNIIENMATDNTTSVTSGSSAKQNSVGINVTALMQSIINQPSLPSAIKFSSNNLGTPADNSRLCFSAVSGGIHKGQPTPPYIKVDYVAPCDAGSTLTTICDTVYCIKTNHIDTCLSAIKDTTFNPYLYGASGNWRMSRAYVYYSNRAESNFSQNTNLRTNGVIQNYMPYWSFVTGGKLLPSADTTKWVWNTESTLFNKRGLELENHNALDIYNAAQYGYNQSLPVAITQNATYREQAYDGFEDYNFPNTQQSCNGCKVARHFVIENASANIISGEAHTGKYSLSVNAGNTVTASSSILSNADSSIGKLSFKIDTSLIPIYNITGGNGLNANYFHPGTSDLYYNDNYGLDNYNSGWESSPSILRTGVNIDYNSSFTNNITDIGAHYYKVVWDGVIMTDVDITANFAADVSNSFKLWINGELIINGFANDPANEQLSGNHSLHFFRGKIYTIHVEHTSGANVGYAHLYWNTGSGNYNLINTNYLYPSVAAAQAALNPNNQQCIRYNGIAQQNLVYNEFAPSMGSRLVLLAWIKEQQDCHCKSYAHGEVIARFYNSYGQQVGVDSSAFASGNIIDGWQRIETYVTVPNGAASMKVFLLNKNDDGYTGKVYFDDLRIHPFNSDMKSYVYDDISLRLMAELDANNYASFYEYDDDGGLVRVKKETEQGIKTIKETRSALLRQ
jgi:hypothetical protein